MGWVFPPGEVGLAGLVDVGCLGGFLKGGSFAGRLLLLLEPLLRVVAGAMVGNPLKQVKSNDGVQVLSKPPSVGL